MKLESSGSYRIVLTARMLNAPRTRQICTEKWGHSPNGLNIPEYMEEMHGFWYRSPAAKRINASREVCWEISLLLRLGFENRSRTMLQVDIYSGCQWRARWYTFKMRDDLQPRNRMDSALPLCGLQRPNYSSPGS